MAVATLGERREKLFEIEANDGDVPFRYQLVVVVL